MGPKIYSRRDCSPNEGSRLLWAVIQKVGSQRALSVALGIGNGMVGRWLRGDQKPTTRTRILLADRYAIPIASWDESPTVPFSLPAA